MQSATCITRRTSGQHDRRGKQIFPSSLAVERIKLQGMCHMCFSSNVPITLVEEDYDALCDRCLEYQKNV